MSIRLITLSALFSTGASNVCEARAQEIDSAGLEAVVEYLDSEVTLGSFPGAVIQVGYRGEGILNRGVGSTTPGGTSSVGDSTIYDIASLTSNAGNQP